MTKRSVPEILNAAFSLTLGLGLPLAAFWLFRAEGPVWAVLVAGALANSLFFLRHRLRLRPEGGGPARAVVSLILGLGFTATALVLVTYIVVIPFAYYLSWFEVVVAQRPGGIISFLFFVVTAWFASLLAGTVYEAGPLRPAAGAAVFSLFVAAVVFRSPLFAVLFTAALVLAVVFLSLVGARPSPRRLVLPLCLLAAVVAGAALFAIDSPPNSGALTKASLITDIKRAIVELFPDISSLSSVSGYGYSFDKNDLGRKPILSKIPLLNVKSETKRTVYLRTQIYDEYFNNNWGVSRFMLERMAAHPDDVLAVPRADAARVNLTVLFDYFPVLPHTLSAGGLEVSGGSPVRVAAGNFDSGFDLARPLLKGTAIRVFEPPAASGVAESLGEEPDTRAWPAGRERDELLPRYLIVPSSLTQRIRALARTLKGNDTDRVKILARIGSYLTDNCVYSLNTSAPPGQEEFLDDFLFVTRRGYCVHFATAYVVLARLCGVPARYATGFVAFLPPGKAEAMVSGMNAHAWPEVWLEKPGWIALEATPAFAPASVGLPDYYRRYNRGADNLTERQLEALMSALVPVTRVERPGLAAALSALAPALPWAVTTVMIAAGIFIVLLLLKKNAGRRRFYRGRMRKINRLLRGLVRRLERRAVPPPEATGWLAWGDAVRARFPGQRRHIRTLARTANRIFFGRAPALRRHVRFIRGLSRRLGTGSNYINTETQRRGGTRRIE